MKFSLTITDASAADLAVLLSAVSGPVKIAHEDRPDVGAPEAPLPVAPPALPSPDAVFPLAPPVPVAAPSTVAAVPAPIAPVAAPIGGMVPMPVAAPPAPPPAPVAPAPTAPAAPTSPAGAVPLDSRGMPWDERIHAQNRAQNGDGTWRAKRGMNDPALKARIEAEIMGAAQAVAPVAPVAPVVPVAPPAPAAPAAWTFEKLLTAIVRGGHINTPKLAEALARVGVAAFGEMAGKVTADPASAETVATYLGLTQ